MTAFPLFIELDNKPCLVIGAGGVALRKVRTLLEFGAAVTVWAKDFQKDFQILENEGKIICCLKNLTCSSTDIDDFSTIINQYVMVVCATDDTDLNHRICEVCKLKHVWVNSATKKEDSTFIFPAAVVRGNVSVGISSSGNVPALTKYIHSQIDELLPPWYSEFEVRLTELRVLAGKKLPTQKMRSEFMTAVTAYGALHQGKISDQAAQNIMLAAMKN